MGLRSRVRGAVEWVRGLRAVMIAMADLDRPPPEQHAMHQRELTASPPPRPRPAPPPARVRRKTVRPLEPAAAYVAKPKVKRGQKHR